MTSTITRRAALVGATTALAASTLPAMATAAFREGRTTAAQLKVALDHFRAAVQAIDPTITGVWAYFDEAENDERGDAKLSGVMFERHGQSTIRRLGSEDHHG